MTARLIIITLLLAMLIGLLALCPILPVSAQATTATYTPIPTRTPSAAATQPVTVITTVDGGLAAFSPSMTAGDAFIVTALGALFALGALAWAYQWVKGHVRTQEQ